MRPSEGSRRHRAGSVDRLLVAVVGGQPVAAAAKLAGMGEETARRRLREPDIAARLNELRIATLAEASDRLTSLAVSASEVLATVMSDPQMPPAVRVRAASEILARVTPMRDAALLEDRITHVETALARREQWARTGGRAV